MNPYVREYADMLVGSGIPKRAVRAAYAVRTAKTVNELTAAVDWLIEETGGADGLLDSEGDAGYALRSLDEIARPFEPNPAAQMFAWTP